MDVSLVLIVVMAVLFACGVYAMLERSLTRVLIGFLLLGNATNLLLLIVMGQPGVAPFFGAAASTDEMSDPLPQALTLTAIVITFAISAFLLALIYRSWQLGQADTVEDDAEDIAMRDRGAAAEDAMDDETEMDADDATTDFVGVDTAPITVLGSRDFAGIRDDAPADRAAPRTARAEPDGEGRVTQSATALVPLLVTLPLLGAAIALIAGRHRQTQVAVSIVTLTAGARRSRPCCSWSSTSATRRSRCRSAAGRSPSASCSTSTGSPRSSSSSRASCCSRCCSSRSARARPTATTTRRSRSSTRRT